MPHHILSRYIPVLRYHLPDIVPSFQHSPSSSINSPFRRSSDFIDVVSLRNVYRWWCVVDVHQLSCILLTCSVQFHLRPLFKFVQWRLSSIKILRRCSFFYCPVDVMFNLLISLFFERLRACSLTCCRVLMFPRRSRRKYARIVLFLCCFLASHLSS